MSSKVSPTLIGAFVVGALSLAIGGLMIFGSGPLFQQTESFVLYFPGSVAGLRTGAPVKFKGVEVGQVTGVYLDMGGGRPEEDTSIPVMIELIENLIRQRGGTAQLDDPEWVAGVIDLGLRGQLLSESILTGRLYVALDIHPDAPAVFRGGPDDPHPEIPTIPAPFEQLQQKAMTFFSELQQIPLDSIGETLQSLLTGLDELVNSPAVLTALTSLDTTLIRTSEMMASLEDVLTKIDSNIDPLAADLDSVRFETAATMKEARLTLESLRILLEPGAPLSYQLEQTLREISAAARSIQALTDYLERNPGALLRGKDVSEENR